MVMGGKPEWPTVEGRLDEFEKALRAEPVRHDPADLELRVALGLRGHGG